MAAQVFVPSDSMCNLLVAEGPRLEHSAAAVINQPTVS